MVTGFGLGSGEARTGQWAEHADLRWPHLSIAVLMGLPFLSGIVASADGADATPADGPEATPADGADAPEREDAPARQDAASRL
ncbi:MAG: hypothetical protein L0G94_02150 [Brachybacterium sp.]|uniref:hypothetical protein n=1 Tax=Brachybacterium sp. TaxID=1891286 RepID=UPI0026486A8B|nr:hypothetical protein [Brachybacterium sp.]MDN5685470.1 hypothetical protein [Brachybacterium sp.]